MSDNDYPYPSQGMDAPYPLQGIADVYTGIALLERAAHAARELGPLPPRVDAAVGTAALIIMELMKRPMSDSANAAAMWAKGLRG